MVTPPNPADTPPPAASNAVEGAKASTDGKSIEQAATGSSSGGYTSKTRIDTLADLRRKAPKVWRSMLEGIAQNIVRGMHRAEERRKRVSRSHR